MPITMGGMASGMDTDGIIKKLVDIESRPIIKLEQRKKNHNQRKEALRVLEKQLKELEKNAKELYGFRASYNQKKSNSSDSSILDAKANKDAIAGLKKIKINRIASNHKIVSDPVKKDNNIKSGKIKIEVNDESIVVKFKGGKLKALNEKISEEASDLVSSSYVKKYGDKYIMTLESKVSGKKGEIKLSGDKELLESIGLVGGKKAEDQIKSEVPFNERYFEDYIGSKSPGKNNGSFRISNKRKNLKMKGLLWKEYKLPTDDVLKKETVLEFDYDYTQEGHTIQDDSLSRLKIGPEERTVIKGIELFGYNVSREKKSEEKKPEKKFKNLFGFGVVVDKNGKRMEKFYKIDNNSKGKMTIPLGNDFSGKKITKLIFYCNKGSVDFTNTMIMTPKKKKGLFEPKNVLAEAENAKIVVDGVEMERDSNKDLNDIIKGVTITLKRPSKKTIDLNIEKDIDKPIDKIRKFVESFNKYVDLQKQLIKTSKSSKPGDYKNNKYDKGLFVGDMVIIRLENILKRTVSAAYPNRADKQIKLLTQMGISTGDINASWETIKEGKLIIDDTKLRSSILNNPEGVSMFFGSDSDGDNRVDSGMAFRVVSVLKPYVSFSKSIIKSKMNLEDESIRLANERIERQQDHIKKYEEKLRLKFAAMEKAMQGAKNQRNWMKNQMGGSGDKEK